MFLRDVTWTTRMFHEDNNGWVFLLLNSQHLGLCQAPWIFSQLFLKPIAHSRFKNETPGWLGCWEFKFYFYLTLSVFFWNNLFFRIKHNYEPNVTLCSSQLSGDEFQDPLKAEERCYMELHKSKSTKTCPCILQFIICF